ncbi:MAG TPA: hypothetical protein PKY96_02730 [Flavobacteriales bacterium]|nr:hypothetical protein [Flavobacteriales bacterium]
MNLLRRFILLPWLLSSTVMFGLSYLWHGVLLSDMQDVTIPMPLYLSLAGVVYLVLGLAQTIATHKAVEYEWISLKKAFPFMTMLLSAVIGFFVYLVIFVLGFGFAKHGMAHVLVDIIWQMIEQSIGGLMVSLGIIYDMHQRFLEQERAQ